MHLYIFRCKVKSTLIQDLEKHGHNNRFHGYVERREILYLEWESKPDLLHFRSVREEFHQRCALMLLSYPSTLTCLYDSFSERSVHTTTQASDVSMPYQLPVWSSSHRQQFPPTHLCYYLSSLPFLSSHLVLSTTHQSGWLNE